MNSFVVTILLCAAATGRAECTARTALDVALAPAAASPIMCALGAQQMIAQTAIQPRAGQYIKISCVRRESIAQN